MNYFDRRDEREHELEMARASNPRTDYSWIATAVGYASVAAVVIVAITSGFLQWALTQ